jgi:hypothetical protein
LNRQLDRNITHLRASKHLLQQQGLSSASQGTESDVRVGSPSGGGRSVFSGIEYAPGMMDNTTSHIGGGGSLPPENSISVLNAALARVLKPGSYAAFSRGLEPIDNFFELLHVFQAGNVEVDDLVSSCLEEVKVSSQVLADACVVTPKQFWKVSDLYCTALCQCPQHTSAFAASVTGFLTLGASITSRDARSAFLLFCDFALPKLTRLLAEHPYKRVGVLRVMLAFQSNETYARVQCIRRLQLATTPDASAFIYCLAVLAADESLVSDTLIDLYCYYASVGIGMSCPKLRSASVSILTSLLAHPQATLMVHVR